VLPHHSRVSVASRPSMGQAKQRVHQGRQAACGWRIGQQFVTMTADGMRDTVIGVLGGGWLGRMMAPSRGTSMSDASLSTFSQAQSSLYTCLSVLLRADAVRHVAGLGWCRATTHCCSCVRALGRACAQCQQSSMVPQPFLFSGQLLPVQTCLVLIRLLRQQARSSCR
jgi:hypothetical protein